MQSQAVLLQVGSYNRYNYW